MKSSEKITDNINDKSLRSLIQSSLPEAPQNPWFTRKVLNRLSDRSQRIAATIEYLLYIVGLVSIIVAVCRISTNAISAEQISIGEIITLTGLAAIGSALLFSLIQQLAAIRK